MDDMIDFMKFTGVLLLFVIAVVVVPIKTLVEYDCAQYGQVADVNTEVFALTCMVEDPDLGWVTYGERKASRYAQKGLSHE